MLDSEAELLNHYPIYCLPQREQVSENGQEKIPQSRVQGLKGNSALKEHFKELGGGERKFDYRVPSNHYDPSEEGDRIV